MWQIQVAEEENHVSDLPSVLSSGDLTSTGCEQFLFPPRIPISLTDMSGMKLQCCPGMELLIISVFPFHPGPWGQLRGSGRCQQEVVFEVSSSRFKMF